MAYSGSNDKCSHIGFNAMILECSSKVLPVAEKFLCLEWSLRRDTSSQSSTTTASTAAFADMGKTHFALTSPKVP